MELWTGYNHSSEVELVTLLEQLVNAAHDGNDTSVDEYVLTHFARAISGYESLKLKNGDPAYRRELHARAEAVSVDAGPGRWRVR